MPRINPETTGSSTAGFQGGAGTIPVLNPQTMTTELYYVPSRGSGANRGSGAGNGGGGGGSVSGGGSSGSERKKKGKKKGKEPYNPFNAPFKTPKQIRAEAARLAALSVASEQSIRQQQAAEQAGITGATSALTGNLQNIQNQITAGLGGLGGLYGRLAGAGQEAAGAAAAAAGAAPGTLDLPGATPAVASQFANLGLITSGVAPAAAVTGTRLVGESLSNLRKSLTDRANQISANTAKYIDQLTQQEYQRSVAQITAQQNAQRLEQQDVYNQGRLAASQERNAISWANLQYRIQRDQNNGVASSKTIRDIKGRLLANPSKYTTDPNASTGKSKYKITWPDGSRDGASATVVASSEAQAIQLAGVPAANVTAHSQDPSGGFGYTVASVEPETGAKMRRPLAIRKMVDILVNAGMTRRQARAWVNSHYASLQLGDLPA